MIKISDSKFLQILSSDKEVIKVIGHHIDLQDSLHIDITDKSFYFENCVFTGQRIDFSSSESNDNEYQSLQFLNCEISNELFIKDCKLYKVEFRNVEISSRSFHITSADIKYISFTGTSNSYNKIESLMLNNLKNDEGVNNLDFRLNNIQTFIIRNTSINTITINANEINRMSFERLICDKSLSFWKNVIIKDSTINDSILNEFVGKGSIYGSGLSFDQVTFKGVCRFENIPNKVNSSLVFQECTFDRSVYFDESYFDKISINRTFFKDIVSFNSTLVNIVKFKSVHFDKVAFFNDFKILHKNLVDIGTIRIIKNQLSKAENKIDYLDYNVIEQSRLLKDKNMSFNDRLLLKLNYKSNNFGSSWIKAIWFTIKVSLLGFFCLLVINHFFNDSGYNYEINFNSHFAPLQELIREWLKFTFSFDLRSYKNYESNGFLLLIFFIFKIFIGYGVYQTIAAFRKHSR